MNRTEALDLLKIDERYPDAARVKQAFRDRCKEIHPDGQPVTLVKCPDIGPLVEARDYLLYSKDSTCNLCEGVGRVRARVGTRTCTACHGTGEKL